MASPAVTGDGFSLSNIAVIIASAILFGQAVNYNTQKLVEQKILIENQDKILADLRTKIAISQIKPHFLYNTLSAISILCDKDINKAKGTTKKRKSTRS